MKIKIKKSVEYDATLLKVKAGVRYWEDAEVDGVVDFEGVLIPCRNEDYWEPVINIDTGVITNWQQGKNADIHYKVCDKGIYELLTSDGETIISINGYVPHIMCPGGSGYGDYIIMCVDENGNIENFEATFNEFLEQG